MSIAAAVEDHATDVVEAVGRLGSGSTWARLRHKLESDPARPRHLRTEPGMGYRFSV